MAKVLEESKIDCLKILFIKKVLFEKVKYFVIWLKQYIASRKIAQFVVYFDNYNWTILINWLRKQFRLLDFAKKNKNIILTIDAAIVLTRSKT